jgi:hypothetical protein
MKKKIGNLISLRIKHSLDFKDNDKYCIILFFVCLTIHLMLSFVGWGNTLCDNHSSRQTLTAISTYYTIKDGFKINYITPVLGKAWAVPLEFPLYQWIVAAVVIISKIPLDQGGRLVSLIFFYFSFIPIYFLLTHFIAKKSHRLIFLCLILASPFFIFWSRTFLIEPLALFLSLSFLLGVVNSTIKSRSLVVLITCVAGTLAGLTKITTFSIYYLAGLIFYFLFRVRSNSWVIGLPDVSKKKFISSIFLFGVPVIINLWYIHFADMQKSLNPIANVFTSYASRWWYIGRIEDKFTWEAWSQILKFSSSIIFYATKVFIISYGFIFGLLFILAQRYRKEALFCLLLFLSGPLVFTNLYYRHIYYYYANAVFLLSSLAFIVVSLLEDNKWKYFTKLVILPALLLTMYSTYFFSYYSTQKKNHLYLRPLIEAIKSHTSESDIILIYGFDWHPEIPYYSQRRALMYHIWTGGVFSDNRFKLALKSLENEKIGGMVVGGETGEDKRKDRVFIEERIKELNLLPHPVFQDYFADFYVTQGSAF